MAANGLCKNSTTITDKFYTYNKLKIKIMPKLTDEIKVEEGFVMGNVSTNRVGSDCTFSVCSVEEYEKMTKEEAYKALEEAMWEAGQIELNF